MNRFCKPASFVQIRFGGFAPDHVGVGSVGQTPCDCSIESAAQATEAFDGPFADNEFAVVRIAVAGDQLCRISVGARDHERRYTKHVGGETGGDQLLYRFLGWDKNFSAQVSALLGR